MAATGQGWLGLAVAESSVPGRWIVDAVAPVGPAAAAGILPGDEVRGINGMPLRSADEVSQALTAIAPGQQVGLAIARGEQVGDVHLIAAARPAAAPAAAATPPAGPSATAAVASEPPAVAPFAAAPPLTASAPAAAVGAATPPSVMAPPLAASGVPPAAVSVAPAPAVPRQVAPSRAESLPPVASAPRELPQPAAPGGRTALGVRTLPIDDGLQARFRLPAASGAYVIGVIQDLPASKAGVPPGSVIVSLDERPVRSPEELTHLVTSGPVGRPVSLEYVLPGGTPQRADVVLQTLEQPLVEALVGPAEPQPTGTPSLEPSRPATTAQRPVLPPEAAAIRTEVEWLRSRLRLLERRLDAVAR